MITLLCDEAEAIRITASPTCQGAARIHIDRAEGSEPSSVAIEIIPATDKRFREVPISLEAISTDVHRAIEEALIQENAT